MTDDELARLRSEYAGEGLLEPAAAVDPLVQFQRWLAEAIAAGVHEPNAVVLATATTDGVPSARMVLLKGADEAGFVFFTNYESRKAAELEANPRCALVLPWHPLQRQVRIEGCASRIAREESAAYFASRPWSAQIGAWASEQSSVIPDRDLLESRYAEMARRWPPGSQVPVPEGWGGYRVAAEVLEFWQGRPGRMHDRIRYRRDGGSWLRERLAP